MRGLLIRFQGRILTLDLPVLLAWGELTGQLSQHGRVLAAIDSLIAATVLYHRCSLVTRNDQDFLDTGVAVVNPWR